MHTDAMMKMKSKRVEEPKTVQVFIRITPTLNDKLKELAEQIGGDAGVATVMRDIVEAALAEGIEVTGGKHPSRTKAA